MNCYVRKGRLTPECDCLYLTNCSTSLSKLLMRALRQVTKILTADELVSALPAAAVLYARWTCLPARTAGGKNGSQLLLTAAWAVTPALGAGSQGDIMTGKEFWRKPVPLCPLVWMSLMRQQKLKSLGFWIRIFAKGHLSLSFSCFSSLPSWFSAAEAEQRGYKTT